MNLFFTGHWPLIAGHVVRPTAEQSDVSGPAVSHRHLPRLDNDGHHPFAAREFQHLGEPGSILFHIHILCLVAKGRPGLVRVGSAHLAVNDDPVCHDFTLHSITEIIAFRDERPRVLAPRGFGRAPLNFCSTPLNVPFNHAPFSATRYRQPFGGRKLLVNEII